MLSEQNRTLGIGVAIGFIAIAGCCVLGIAGGGLIYLMGEDDGDDIDADDAPAAVAQTQPQTDDDDGEEELRFESMGLGITHGCAIDTDQRLHCWGIRTHQATDDPPEGRFIDVDSGHRHSCAIDTDHQLHCWGDEY